MRIAMTRLLAIGFAVPLGLAALGAAPGFAQSTGPGGTGMARGLGRGGAPDKTVAPPPVLPGTKAPGEVAPATAPVATLTPTEALFDAVNRGDIGVARDAVNRGARIDTVNELGLTALDLSIDLGRNDIAFFLLSMRPEDPAMRRDADRRDLPASMVPQATEAPRRAVAVPPVRRAAADEPATAVPRYVSGYAGAPIPSAGFLGFGGR